MNSLGLTVEPTGPFSTRLVRTAELLCQCEALQAAIVGPDAEGSPRDVGQRLLYQYALADDAGLPLPYLIVELGESADADQVAGGGKNYLRDTTPVTLVIRDLDRDPENEPNSLVHFTNLLGAIWCHLKSHAGRDEWPNLEGIRQLLTPHKFGLRESAGQAFWETAWSLEIR